MIAQIGESVTDLRNGIFFEDIRMAMDEAGYLKLTLTARPSSFLNQILHCFFLALSFLKIRTYDPHLDTACMLGVGGAVFPISKPKAAYNKRGFRVTYLTLKKVGDSAVETVFYAKDGKTNLGLETQFEKSPHVEFVFAIRTDEKIRPRWAFKASVTRLDN